MALMNVSTMTAHTKPPSMYLALLSALLMVMVYSVDVGDKVVDMDSRSVIINGTRELILSGSVHYARVLQQIGNGSFSWQRNEFEHH